MTIVDFNNARRQGEPVPGHVDADDIRQRLHDDPKGFVEWLYSGRAFISKNEARIGNVYGEPGASLSIHLSGPHTGLWKDHGTDEGGDLIGLYRACMGYTDNSTFIVSLKEIAKDYLGDPVEVPVSPWQPSATDRINKQKEKLGTKPRDDMLELGAPVATWKYYDTRGNVIASVVRYEPDGTTENKTFRPYCFKMVDGKNKWVMGTPDMRPLYRLPDIASASTVVLVEGEKAAQALADCGIQATTAMQGAYAEIEKTDWSPLIGKTVIVWPDHDKPGHEYGTKAIARLTQLGCKVLCVTPPVEKPPKWDAADCIADGMDPNTLLAAATVLVEAAPRPRVRLLDIDELEHMQPPVWMIEDIITERGLSMIWGRSGSLKSFIALDMGLCIATGLDWHRKKVKKGKVIYLAAEGSHGLAGRAIGWRKTRGRDLPKPDFHLIPHGLNLSNPSDLDAMIAALADMKPTFIVVDTVSRTFGGGNPNQPSDMNVFVAALDKLKEATGAHVLTVHHGGKSVENNEVGNEGLRNACDTVIHVRRKGEAKTVELINEAPKGKQKDSDEFKPITLEAVKIAYDHAGEERTTLVLNLSNEAKPPDDDGTDEPQGDEFPKQDKLRGLGANQKKIVDAITMAGTGLGRIRIQAMTGIGKNLNQVINPLLEKNILKVEIDASGNEPIWSLV